MPFDNSVEFYGDYAPVVKDGKAFLIDRKMKRVSETVDADSVFTIGSGLYVFGSSEKRIFVTYSGETVKVTEIALSVPKNVRVGKITENSAKLTWDAVDVAESYIATVKIS